MALAIGILGALFVAVSLLDPNFTLIVTKPDNVPIVIMLFLVGFFLWLSHAPGRPERRAHRARRAADGGQQRRGREDLVWPDLVYTEFICMVLSRSCSWSGRSCSRPRSRSRPTRPARPTRRKAPWYFLGLQEMLVYFDPWMAGVVLPSLIIVGLMAIPYIDTNPKGNGYYTFKERKFAIIALPVRLPRPVGAADRPRHLPARAELELLRALRVLGPAQGRAADQRQPLRVLLGAPRLNTRPAFEHDPARARRGSCWWPCYLVVLPGAAGQDGAEASSS